MKNKYKKRGVKPLKAIDNSEVVGKCYICRCDITRTMIALCKALAIGKGMHRCRSKKCEKHVVDVYLKRLKTRKIWGISPVTKIVPNKKKKTRAKINREFRKEAE